MNSMAFSSFVLHDVALSEMDDVTQDMGIRDERGGLSPQTLSDTTEEESTDKNMYRQENT